MTQILRCQSCEYFSKSLGDPSEGLWPLASDNESLFTFWRQNRAHYLGELNFQIDSIQRTLSSKKHLVSTENRLKNLRSKLLEQKKTMSTYLSFLGPDAQDFVFEDLGEAEGFEFTRYFPNVFQDWAWNNISPSAFADGLMQGVFSLVSNSKKNISECKTVLALGAGSGRAALEFAYKFTPQADLYLLDYNPFLLKVGQDLNSELSNLEFVDFPIYPQNTNSVAIPTRLSNPRKKIPNKVFYVWGESENLPFAPESMDCVFTSWFLDIDSRGPAGLMNQVAKILKPGGVWVNTGPLAFARNSPEFQWSPEEITELLNIDFESSQTDFSQIPYLNGPSRYQKRIETVFEFIAVRKAQIQNISTPLKRDLELNDIPVKSSKIQTENFKHEVLSFVLSQVNGVNSVGQIANAFSQKYGVELIESEKTVLRFLKKLGL